jgi:FkbM family methyltransferase
MSFIGDTHEHRNPKQVMRDGLSAALGRFGWDLIRTYRQPWRSMLGLSHLTPPILTVIDVGANRGQFAEAALRCFPFARVISFEPLPGIFDDLAKLADLSQGRLLAVQSALGEECGTGTTTMQMHLDWNPSSSLLPTTSNAEQVFPEQRRQRTLDVPITTLDEFFSENFTRHERLDREILIKLDCQGFDDRVIRGGPRIFSQARACLVEINFDPFYAGQPSFLTIFELLSGHGMRYVGNLQQTYAQDGHVMFVDALFLRD